MLNYQRVNLITTEPCSPSLEIMVNVRGIIPLNGLKIQANEILFHLAKINIDRMIEHW